MHIERLDVYVFASVGVFAALAFSGKLPPVESLRKFVAMFDDTGGNILIVGGFSAWFFATAIRLFYYAIALISNGMIDAKDAILMMALSWVTGSAFGLAFGALLKTLKGVVTVAPPFASVSGTPAASAPPATIPPNKGNT